MADGKRGAPKFEITDQIIKDAETFAEKGLTLEQIAHCLGISYQTLNEKKKEFADFSDAIKRGQANGIRKVANKVFDKAIEGDMTAAIFYLKARAKWSDKPEVEAFNEENRPKRLGVEGYDPGNI